MRKKLKMIKLKIFLLVLFWFHFNAVAVSNLRFPEWPSKSQPLNISLQTEFFRTQANYTQLGLYDDLPDESYFQYTAIHPRITYSPLSWTHFELFANSFYAMSKKQNIQRDVFRVALVGGGFAFYKNLNFLTAGLELRGGVPLLGNFQTPDELIVGDGAYFVEPGLWLLFQPTKVVYIYGHTAFRYRMFSLSGLLWGRLGGVLQTQYIDAGLGLDSFYSLIPDQYSLQPQFRWDPIEKVNAGSYKFYSVDPAVLSWIAWMEFKFQPLFAKIYFNLDSLGKNYAKGFSFGLVTTLRFNTRSSIADKRRGSTFDPEDFEAEEDLEKRPAKKDSSYFKEEADPYEKKGMSQELKEELNTLRH